MLTTQNNSDKRFQIPLRVEMVVKWVLQRYKAYSESKPNDRFFKLLKLISLFYSEKNLKPLRRVT